MNKVKKILIGMILIIIVLPTTLSVIAADNIKVMLDNKRLSFDVQPQIINDRTMVPFRVIFEALGASVDWDASTKTVISQKDSTEIELTINSNKMYVNDKKVTIDAPACIVNDRTLVPLRAISEALDCDVEWISSTRTVLISTPDENNGVRTNEVQSTSKPKVTEKPIITPKPTEKPIVTEEPAITKEPVSEYQISLSYKKAEEYLDKYLKKNVNDETYQDITYEKIKEPVTMGDELVYEFLLTSKNDGKFIKALYVHENGKVTN